MANKVVFRDVRKGNQRVREELERRKQLLESLKAHRDGQRRRPFSRAEEAELKHLEDVLGEKAQDPLLRWTRDCVVKSFETEIDDDAVEEVLTKKLDIGAPPNGDKQKAVVKWLAIYGLLALDGKVAPAGFDESGNKGDGGKRLPLDADQEAARDAFYRTFFTAASEYQANEKLFEATLAELRRLGHKSDDEFVDAKEWAATARALAAQHVTADDPQIGRRVNVALGDVQGSGDGDAPPSSIEIDVPDLEQATETTLSGDNIKSHIPTFMSMTLEELKVHQVVDKLVELFQNGLLPIGRGKAGNFLYKYWRESALRIGEPERRSIYARAFGAPGGDDVALPNREFNDLWLRFISAVSSFIRQFKVDDLLRSQIPAPISQQQVRKSAWDLAANLSLHGFGISYFAATELQQQIKDMIQLLSAEDIRAAYGARDMWQVVDQVAGLELGGARNSVKYRTMATAGAMIISWLARNADRIQKNVYDDLIDIETVRYPPARGNAKATAEPTDYDLVNACEQWLAVSAIDDARVEEYAQPHEAPLTTGRPIQIPAVAREMLDSIGVPGLGLGLGYSAGEGGVAPRRGNGQVRAQQ